MHEAAVLAQVSLDRVADQYWAWGIDAATFLAVLLGVYLVGRLLVLPPLISGIRARNPRDPTLVDAVEQYLKVGFVVVGVPLATTAAGFGGVVAGSAVVVAAGTLALGVAGQDVIGNLVSGVFLVADPDFRVGDYVEWGDQAGTVQTIDLRVTRVRTPDGEKLTVPNTDLATSALRHPYTGDRYRLSERLTIAYGDDVELATEVLCAAAREDDRVLADPEPVVRVDGFGGSGIDLVLRVWVSDPKRSSVAEVRSGVVARGVERLRAAGVTVAPANAQDLSGRIEVDLDETA